MRLGVLGGTFDPIHLGHLLLAEQAREQMACERLILIPAGRPPHKPDRRVTPFPLRLQMVNLAIAGIPDWSASDLERDLSRPSYTADTLRRLQNMNPGGEEIALIMGSDSLFELASWKEPEEILRLATLAVYPRPAEAAEANGAPLSLAPLRRELPWLREDRVQVLEGPRIRLSSSEIRGRVRDGKSIRFLVPEAVRSFIAAQGLYGPLRDPHGQ